MIFSVNTLVLSLHVLATIPAALAGFSTSSSSNVAVYYGQNSYGAGSGPLAQQRLSAYCSNTNFNIIPLAFLLSITQPTINFANAGNNCTAIADSTLLSCPQLAADISTCQNVYGKTILLSVGGATYTEGGFSSAAAATAAANNIWAIFGPVKSGSTVARPFGTSVIDGFDFDFESTVSNMVPFAKQLRSLMDAVTTAGGKRYYLTAAPQCPYPDAADKDMLAGAVYFDAIWVQFYNNYCGLQSYTPGTTVQNNFNFATWQNWAKTVSLNPNVKVFLGVPASSTAAGSGYLSAAALAPIIKYCKTFSSFGGVMMWDMSQAFANSGFLSGVAAALGTSAASISTTAKAASTSKPSTTPKPTTTSKSSSTTLKVTTSAKTATSSKASVTPKASVSIGVTASGTAGTVAEWNQCGGQDYSGNTQCSSGLTCVPYSVWYSQCEKVSTNANTSAGLAAWMQCGGQGYTGPTTCQVGLTCVTYGVWYSQCQ
ncbi:glycoside hydrolase family 18 protein [Coleophoma crateriformis]|uniref:chitinase n=1 Tax=Coleophoma crateriformis TaxID=565419 RepID=A0A3D8SLX0_9HELO|nr:glycoside hydrolase family 18 protein [Coleophoma crateriformis]